MCYLDQRLGCRSDEKHKQSSDWRVYRGRNISGPHGQCVPLDVVQKGGAVFTQAINELTGQGGGELEELISVEERRHCGVQADGGRREKTTTKNKFITLWRLIL